MAAKQVLAFNPGMMLPLSRAERKRPWSIPSYDFQFLLDPRDEGSLLGRLPPERDLRQSKELERCVLSQDRAFLFSSTENGRVVRRLWVARWGTKGGGRVRDHDARYWFYISDGGGTWVSHHPQDHLQMRQAVWLLNNPQLVSRDVDPADIHAANGPQHLHGKRPVPITSIIRLTRTVAAAPSQAHGSGSPKRPHDRRGYTFVRRGKTIVVKGPIRVKGGATTAQAYRVVR